jgi:glycosyltransferase involved in cell wall biosynthesis
LAGLRDWIAYRQLSRYYGTFVTVQDRRREMLCDFLNGRARTKTVFNGVPSIDPASVRSLRETKRRELGLSDRDFLVIGVGRLVEQKRPFRFLQVAKELHARLPNTKFFWVGDGKLARQWQDAIAHEGLQGVVSCVGWQADVQPYQLAGDLLLHVAEFEGLPFVIIEAMATKLACAVTRDLASEIPALNEDNVLFVDDIDELAAKVRDPLIVAKIAEAGRCLFEKRFSVEKMAESYEQLYVDAMRKKCT